MFFKKNIDASSEPIIYGHDACLKGLVEGLTKLNTVAHSEHVEHEWDEPTHWPDQVYT